MCVTKDVPVHGFYALYKVPTYKLEIPYNLSSFLRRIHATRCTFATRYKCVLARREIDDELS